MTPYALAEAAFVELLAPILAAEGCDLINSPKTRLPQVRSRCNILLVSSVPAPRITKSSYTQQTRSEFAANFLNADLHNHAESYPAIHALQRAVMGFQPLENQGYTQLTGLDYIPPNAETKQAWGYQVRFAFTHYLV